MRCVHDIGWKKKKSSRLVVHLSPSTHTRQAGRQAHTFLADELPCYLFFGLVRCVSMWRARSSSLKWEKKTRPLFLTRGQKEKSGEKKKIVEIGISLRVVSSFVPSFSNLNDRQQRRKCARRKLRTDTIWDQIITAPNKKTKKKKQEKVFLLDGDQFEIFITSISFILFCFCFCFLLLRNLKNFELMLPEMIDRRHGNDALLREALLCRVLFWLKFLPMKSKKSKSGADWRRNKIHEKKNKKQNTQTNKTRILNHCLVAKKMFRCFKKK